jgi:hypothetical protein
MNLYTISRNKNRPRPPKSQLDKRVEEALKENSNEKQIADYAYQIRTLQQLLREARLEVLRLKIKCGE